MYNLVSIKIRPNRVHEVATGLFFRGKGDYYRLGHGTEDHVRRPKRVLAFEAKVVTSICCGSLHCVACTEDGEVYCWGDNDEGQLGDNTTNAGQQPKLCIGLQVGFQMYLSFFLFVLV